jgi:hypothetical protein
VAYRRPPETSSPGRNWVTVLDSTTASAKHVLCALGRRWLDLAGEIASHDRVLEQLTRTAAPNLCDAFGIGADTAAEMLIVFGKTPNGSAPKRPSRSSAASHRSPHPPD